MSTHIYGPVPSRRLGRSLGIDLTPPLPNKTCNFNCVYCQLGRTRHFTNQRREFFPVEKLIKGVKDRIQTVGTANIDYLTMVGDGEPTLYSKLGVLIQSLKKTWDIPICVITNGALLYSEKVRNELMFADLIMPTLDAGTEEEFKLINRPIRYIIFNKMVDGMISFSNSYTGKIWMEFMALKGVNDNYDSLIKTRDIYAKINPDRIFINTPIRPTTEDWAQTPTLENIELIQKILEPTAKEGVIPINFEEQGEFFIEGEKESDIIQNLILTIKRHPMQLYQIKTVLEKKKMRHPEEILEKILEQNIQQTEFRGKVFFSYCEP